MDASMGVANLKQHQTSLEDGMKQQMVQVAALETDVKNLKDWQKDQSGALIRVAEKIDKLQFWMMTQVVGLSGTFVLGVIMFLLNYLKK